MAFIKIKNNKFLTGFTPFRDKTLTGFTLVEILVTIGIMVIIFSIVTLNLNARKPQVMVENAAREFLSQLQFAKNLALTGAVFLDEDNPTDDQLDVPFGYGLHFFNNVEDQNKYFIFGDLYDSDSDGNKKYDDLRQDGLIEETGWGNFIVDDKVNVDITSIDLSIVVYPLDIFFETFNGRINYYYNGMDQPSEVDQLKVKFSYTDDPSINQTVIINKNTNQIYLLE